MDQTNDIGADARHFSADSPSALLELLRSPLEVIQVQERDFPGGWRTPDEVIVSSRLMWVRRGRMRYQVEGQTREVSAGMQFLVPSWVRRQWRVPRNHSCQLVWCEFASSQPGSQLSSLRWSRPKDLDTEAAMFQRMQARWAEPPESSPDLADIRRRYLEAELKAGLARFWSASWIASRPASSAEGETHPLIRSALQWLEVNYASPSALTDFYRWLPASPNHFRQLFRAARLGTVQYQLARLRLRRARYLIHETTLSLKEIAAQTGFNDPLFFSRQYRQFWKHPPSADRSRERGIG